MMYSSFRGVFVALFLGTIIIAASAGTACAAGLPIPQMEDGMSLFEALRKRSSAAGGDFPTGKLDTQDLSTILWAATGLNRGKNGWTVPMARGLEPYCKVYAADDSGVFMYDWNNNSLMEVSKENIRAKAGSQNFVRRASCVLIIVSDGKLLAEFEEPERNDFAYAAAGAMTQNIYLASAALGVGARYIHSMNIGEIRSALKLTDEDKPICLMMLGR